MQVVEPGIAHRQRDGPAHRLGPHGSASAELAFDEDECARVCGASDLGAEVRAHAGGWSLGVALRGRHALGSPSGALLDHGAMLAELAVADLAEPARNALVALARLPRFPARLLGRFRRRRATCRRSAGATPWLIAVEDDWWAPKEWLRDALRKLPADAGWAAEVARAVGDVGEDELAAELLVADGMYESAVPLIERLAAEAIRDGRPAWVRAVVGSLLAARRTFALDPIAATAAQALNIVDAPDQGGRSVISKTWWPGPRRPDRAQLRAQALLASHYRMQADHRVFMVCEQALGDVLDDGCPSRTCRVGGRPTSDRRRPRCCAFTATRCSSATAV